MKIKSSDFFISKLACDNFIAYSKNDMVTSLKGIENSLELLIDYKHFVNVCIFFKQFCKFIENESIKREGIRDFHFEVIKSYSNFTNDTQRFMLICINSDIVNEFCSRLNRIMEYHINWNMANNFNYIKFTINSARPDLIFKYLISELLAQNLDLEIIS